jgi:hypothetical protein
MSAARAGHRTRPIRRFAATGYRHPTDRNLT